MKLKRASDAYIIPGLLHLQQNLKITPDIILHIICEYFKIETDKINTKSRYIDYAIARHCYVYYLRTMFNYTYEKCGTYINRNHSSTMHCFKKYNELNNYNDYYRRRFKNIDNEIKKNEFFISQNMKHE